MAEDAIVYVHGFNSSADRWLPLARTVRDLLPDVDQLSFEYPSAWYSSWLRRRFSAEADSLREWISAHASRYKRVLIVAHSVGCIVAREVLVTRAEQGSARVLPFFHCFFITPPFRGIHVQGLESVFCSVLPRAGIFYRIAYFAARIAARAGAARSVKARELSYDSPYLMQLHRRAVAAGGFLPRSTMVFADYDKLIGGATIRRRIEDDEHSVAAWHGAARWNMIPRQDKGIPRNATLVQAICGVVGDARAARAPTCLFCVLQRLFDRKSETRYDVDLVRDLLAGIDSALENYPDNEDLVDLKRSAEGDLGIAVELAHDSGRPA